MGNPDRVVKEIRLCRVASTERLESLTNTLRIYGEWE